jgi:hypothetical protein
MALVLICLSGNAITEALDRMIKTDLGGVLAVDNNVYMADTTISADEVKNRVQAKLKPDAELLVIGIKSAEFRLNDRVNGKAINALWIAKAKDDKPSKS